MKNEDTVGGSQAIRIRRVNEVNITSASKLEAAGLKEKVRYIIFLV